MQFWVPTETTTATTITRKPSKPVVVLIHGFVGDGITNWYLQVGSLTKHYSVYVPDLLFFGGSKSDEPERSPDFKTECLTKGLTKLGVEKCTVVGFSYAELYPDFVQAVVVTGSVREMTHSIADDMLHRFAKSSFSEMLLPVSGQGLKALLSVGAHMTLWFPNKFYMDFLEVMYSHRKERSELLEGMIVSNTDTIIHHFSHKMFLLWGEDDQIFKFELAKTLKRQLGDKASIQSIKKAGHIVHFERPFVFNKCLEQFLHSLEEDEEQKVHR